MPFKRDNPYGILFLAIPFVVGGIILVLRNTPGIVPAFAAGGNSPDAQGFYLETTSVTMEHVGGTLALVVGGLIVWFYFRLRND